MKILHIDFTGTFNEEMSYQEVLIPKYNAQNDHEVIMLTTCYRSDNNGDLLYTPPVDLIMHTSVRLIRLEYKNIINAYITRKIRKVEGLYILLDQLLPDIIFFHCPQTIELLTIVKYAKMNPSVHIFVDNHADYINSVPNWLSRRVLHKIIWKYCAKKIEPYVTKFYGVTPLRCDFLRDMYNISSDKIELLVMGADDDMINFNKKEQIRRVIRNNLRISENDFVIVTGGKIDEKKNIHLLMQAVNELTSDNVKLIVFGTPNQKMKLIIEELSKSNYIRNIGWIRSEKVYDFFLASDLAFFPGTHSVLWEQAIGTGIPCVFKYWKGMDHVDLGGNCKFLYTNYIIEIKSVLEEIITNKSIYQEMKKVAENIGIKKFSYKEIASKAIQF